MDHKPSFQTFVSWIFKSMELDGGAALSSSSIYTIKLGPTLQVQLIERKTGHFCFMSVAGAVPRDATPAMLKALLHANQFTFDYPQICLGVEPDIESVVLSTHGSLAGFAEESAIAQFDRFAEMARLVHQWLEAGGKSSETLRAKRSTSSILQLKARHLTASSGDLAKKP